MKLLNTLFSKTSSLKTNSAHEPTLEELDGFKKAQALSYDCAVTIAKELKPGWTEKQTSKLMDTFLKDHGVKHFFHKSFAWFGEHSKFHNFKTYFDFLPSKTTLKENDVIILDTAPIVNGFAGDIGFTFSLTPNEELKKARSFLIKQREELQIFFSSELTADLIWKKIDENFKNSHYINCHKDYPFAVLGHRLHEIPFQNLPSIGIPFTLHSYWALFSRGLIPELLGPWHSGTKLGIWAIEPHLGLASHPFGAKFEEILVVTKEKTYWLQDDVPHLKLPKGLY